MPLIRCPSCKTVFSASEGARGGVMPCPSCAQLCRIPAGISPPPKREAGVPVVDMLEEVEELDEVPEVEAAGDDAPKAVRPGDGGGAASASAAATSTG